MSTAGLRRDGTGLPRVLGPRQVPPPSSPGRAVRPADLPGPFRVRASGMFWCRRLTSGLRPLGVCTYGDGHLITSAGSSRTVVRVISCICDCVCVCVSAPKDENGLIYQDQRWCKCTIHGSRYPLSVPRKWDGKVKAQSEEGHSRTLLLNCATAAGVGLHVDWTAHALSCLSKFRSISMPAVFRRHDVGQALIAFLID